MNFSIITCTYNPDELILKRLGQAIINLKIPKSALFEWIIVDNNSSIPVGEKFMELHKLSFVKIVKEKRPGLTNARIKGINEAKHDWIIFFDDDNEPDSDYLVNACKLLVSNSDVACWGPGNISVVFYNKDKWIEKYKHIYQERHTDQVKIYNNPKWQEGYPQGTGQIIKKKLLFDYIKKVEKGIYSMSDRSGNNLSSGGDVQIVLNVIKKGKKVGISEMLSLKHNIEESKANFKYLFKLIYGMASSAVLAQTQVFPELREDVSITNKNVLRIIILYFRQFKISAFSKEKLLVFAQRIGDLNATYIAYNYNFRKPLILRIVERICF